jgi:penicillin-binding protein 2
LHGDTGYQQLLVNAQGRRVDRVGISAPQLVRKEPIAGNDLILSLDLRVQKAAEEALVGQRAAVVAIDPTNGDVIAFVSTPDVRPERFRRGLTVPEYRALADDIDKPLIDRAMRGVFIPPGSTIKPLVALAALEVRRDRADGTRYCKGVWQFPGSSHRYRDWKKGGHGTVNMHSAIAQSCDTYFYGVSDHDRHRPHARLSWSGSASVRRPASTSWRAHGLVPSREWKRHAFKTKSLQVWFPGETVIAGIGQGYMLATNPCSLRKPAAAISMRGQRFQPRLVRAIRNSATGEGARVASRTNCRA